MPSSASVFQKILSAVLLLYCTQLKAQVVNCPTNLNFELGNLQEWICRTGEVSVGANGLVYNWNAGTQQVENRHTVLSANSTDLDVYGRFPIQSPNGSPYVVKLGNNFFERQAESISYTYAIPASVTNFSIIYYYAVVFEDPGHEPEEQPRFSARVVDNATNQPLNCVSFDFTAAAGLPGFRESTFKPGVLYKDWTPVSLDLSEYAGKTVRIEFTTNDCTRGGHFGYAYVALDPTCSGNLSGSVLCGDQRSATLQAPFGYASYTWFAGQDFNTVLSTDRILTLPNPATGTIISLRIVPFPGFGCEDTIFTTITRAPKPVANAGADQIACRNQGVILGSAAVNGYAYSWTPAAFVNDPTAAAPVAVPFREGPNRFIVNVTDLSSGCKASDTVLLTRPTVDTAVTVNGAMAYCEGDLFQTTLNAAAGLSSLQWYRNDQLLPGAVQGSFSPATEGVYYAVIWQNGCSDTSSRFSFTVNKRPVADFATARDEFCNHTPIQFNNGSSIADNSSLTWQWDFSDGSSSQLASPTVSFPEPGNLQATLQVIASNGCSNSISKSIRLLPRVLPEFDWALACTNTPVLFNNLSQAAIASASEYSWDFGNGLASNEQQPVAIAYPNAGEYRVRLSVISPGCEDLPLVNEQLVRVVQSQVPQRYFKKIMLPGEVLNLQARSVGNQFQWNPASMLENPNASFTRFSGTESVDLTVTITEPSGCSVVDSVEVVVLKTDAVWMPTAFSPNGDGLNDVLRPFVAGSNQLIRFSIFNRQGTRIFYSSRPEAGWDGTANGRPAAPDVYVWMIEYSDAAGKKQVAKGTLTLVR